MRQHRQPGIFLRTRPQGYSLVELLVSVSIIIILMAMLFQFMASNQKQYLSQQVQSEVSQGPRSAFEIMGVELNQAGYNPPFGRSRSLVNAASAAGSSIVDLTLSGGGVTPITRGIFYGTRLIIGNTCTTSGSPAVTTCDQEEVPVTSKSSYALSGATRAITANTVPVVLTNNHAAGETVYSRNYPYPTGVYYDNRTASATPIGIADNKVKFYGDIVGTGDLYYGEYRLQKYDPSTGTYTTACTSAASSVGPFVLTRYLTKLADPSTGVFEIPASKATAFDGAQPSPLVDNIQGTCASLWTGGYTWPYNAPDETSPTGSTAVNKAISYTSGTAVNVDPLLNPDGTPAMWLKMYTFGAYDTTTSTAYYQSFVVDVRIALTVQRGLAAAQGGAVSTQRLQTHIVPRNIWDALTIAQGGGSSLLPQTPIDPTTGNTLPLN
jgi:type II secretory pathway pseudopilin PulG